MRWPSVRPVGGRAGPHRASSGSGAAVDRGASESKGDGGRSSSSALAARTCSMGAKKTWAISSTSAASSGRSQGRGRGRRARRGDRSRRRRGPGRRARKTARRRAPRRAGPTSSRSRRSSSRSHCAWSSGAWWRVWTTSAEILPSPMSEPACARGPCRPTGRARRPGSGRPRPGGGRLLQALTQLLGGPAQRGGAGQGQREQAAGLALDHREVGVLGGALELLQGELALLAVDHAQRLAGDAHAGGVARGQRGVELIGDQQRRVQHRVAQVDGAARRRSAPRRPARRGAPGRRLAGRRGRAWRCGAARRPPRRG